MKKLMLSIILVIGCSLAHSQPDCGETVYTAWEPAVGGHLILLQVPVGIGVDVRGAANNCEAWWEYRIVWW